MDRARDTEEVVRSSTATWQNIARRVEERIGHGFKISEATVRHCVAAKRSNSTVAALHKPIVAVLRRKFARALDEWHVDGHFSNKLVKCAITIALHREHSVVSWDDHACWEFSSSTFTTLPMVMSSRLHKTAPHNDATVVTGQLKCVTNTVLFYLPKECGSSASDVSQKYEFQIRKVPFGVTRVVSERRSTSMQQTNDLQLVLSQPQVHEQKQGGEITFICDGGWDHNPRNSEVCPALTFEHLVKGRLYTNASVRAAGMSSYNVAERVNSVETRAVQNACIKDAVFLPEDDTLPAAEALQQRRRRFQMILTEAIAAGVYARKKIVGLACHPDVPGSDTYSTEFWSHCRAILDGSAVDMPVDRHLHIWCVLRYQQLHCCAGHFDFQLRRTAYKHVLGHLCTAQHYPCAPTSAPCNNLAVSCEDICPFLDDHIVRNNGQFLSSAEVEQKKHNGKKNSVEAVTSICFVEAIACRDCKPYCCPNGRPLNAMLWHTLQGI